MKDGQAGPEAMYQFCQRLVGEACSGCRHRLGAQRNAGGGTPPHPANTADWVLLARNKAGGAPPWKRANQLRPCWWKNSPKLKKAKRPFHMGFISLQTEKLHVLWNDNDYQAWPNTSFLSYVVRTLNHEIYPLTKNGSVQHSVAHHRHSTGHISRTHPSCITKTHHPLPSNPKVPLPSAPDNHHSTLFIWTWPFPIPPVGILTQLLSLCDWLHSLSKMSSRLTHVIARGRIPFFSGVELSSITCTDHIFFIHVSVDGHFGCFHVLSYWE